jgi:hypothetical protein
MLTAVYKKEYKAPEIDRREALRYAGVRGQSPDAERLLSEVISECAEGLSYKVVYALLSPTMAAELIGISADRASSTPERPYSELYSKRLEGAERVVIFAASIGVLLDRMVKRYEVTSPAKAVMLDALGSERVEALLDAFCEDINREVALDGCRALPRFSPGYGDLPLALQARIISILDAGRQLGIALNESLLMSPSKSVTAIMGIVKDIH